MFQRYYLIKSIIAVHACIKGKEEAHSIKVVKERDISSYTLYKYLFIIICYNNTFFALED